MSFTLILERIKAFVFLLATFNSLVISSSLVMSSSVELNLYFKAALGQRQAVINDHYLHLKKTAQANKFIINDMSLQE